MLYKKRDYSKNPPFYLTQKLLMSTFLLSYFLTYVLCMSFLEEHKKRA